MFLSSHPSEAREAQGKRQPPSLGSVILTRPLQQPRLERANATSSTVLETNNLSPAAAAAAAALLALSEAAPAGTSSGDQGAPFVPSLAASLHLHLPEGSGAEPEEEEEDDDMSCDSSGAGRATERFCTWSSGSAIRSRTAPGNRMSTSATAKKR